MRKYTLLIIILAVFGGLMAVVQGPGGFSFDFRQEGGRYHFQGRFAVDTDVQGVWEVLTDYNNISHFVANMNGRVLKREGDELFVDQTVGGGFLFIRQEVKGVFRVQEKPFESICLEEVTRKHFDLYEGTWSIDPVPTAEGLRVAYSLQAERNKDTPGFVTPGLFRQAAEDLVIGMKKEMDRREAVRRMNSKKAAKEKGGT